MAEETIIADEQNEIDESNDTEDESNEDEVDVEDLKARLAKAEADKEKWEARYKSSKKQEASKPKETKVETKQVDLESLVEKKLTAMQEQKDFIAEHWEEVFNEVKKIKDKHPTLSWKDAYKISPVAADQASKENAESLAMWGRPSNSAITDSKSITMEQYVALPQKQYRLMKERIAKGEVTLIQK